MVCEERLLFNYSSVVIVIGDLHSFIVHLIISILLHGAVCFGMRGGG